MATIEYTKEEVAEKLRMLDEPFPEQVVHWRVVSTNKDKSQGMVVPYVKPIEYHRRLDAIFGPGGWSVKLLSQTVMGLTRKRGNETLPSGKITVTAEIEIAGIAKKSSIGEMWADDENAATSAEAQAFKRSCAQFGLGRYLNEVREDLGPKAWVPIDNYKMPKSLPQLPEWARHPRDRKPNGGSPAETTRSAAPSQTAGATGAKTGTGTRPAQANGSVSASSNLLDKDAYERDRAHFEAALGQPLVQDVLNRVVMLEKTGALQGKTRYAVASETLRKCEVLLTHVRSRLESMSEFEMNAVFDMVGISNLDIRTYEELRQLVDATGLRSTKRAA